MFSRLSSGSLSIRSSLFFLIWTVPEKTKLLMLIAVLRPFFNETSRPNLIEIFSQIFCLDKRIRSGWPQSRSTSKLDYERVSVHCFENYKIIVMLKLWSVAHYSILCLQCLLTGVCGLPLTAPNAGKWYPRCIAGNSSCYQPLLV